MGVGIPTAGSAPRRRTGPRICACRVPARLGHAGGAGSVLPERVQAGCRRGRTPAHAPVPLPSPHLRLAGGGGRTTPEVVAKLLGHADATVTWRSTRHLWPEHLDDAVAGLLDRSRLPPRRTGRTRASDRERGAAPALEHTSAAEHGRPSTRRWVWGGRHPASRGPHAVRSVDLDHHSWTWRRRR